MEAKLQDTPQRAIDNHSSSETSDVLKWKADGFELKDWLINKKETFIKSDINSLLSKIIENFSSNYSTFIGVKNNPSKEDKLKKIYKCIPDSVKSAIYDFKEIVNASEKFKGQFSASKTFIKRHCLSVPKEQHDDIIEVFNYVQKNYSPNEKNKETDTQVYQDIKEGLKIMIGSRSNDSKVEETEKVAEKRKMKDIIQSLKPHLKNKSSDGCETRCVDKTSQEDKEIQEFMNLLSESLTQKEEKTEDYIITDEQLINILSLARSAHVRFFMNNDQNTEALNTRLIKLLCDVRNQQHYKQLVTSIIYTILNYNDIKKSDYKTVMDILLNEDCQNKYENFLEICEDKKFNEIQKLFCCVMLTAKDKLDSKINVSDGLDMIIQNFMIKHNWSLKEQKKKNKENSATNKSDEEKKETLEEAYRRVIEGSIIDNDQNSKSNDKCYDLIREFKLNLEKDKLGSRNVDFYIKFKKNGYIKISDELTIPILAGTEIIIEVDGPTHFIGNIVPTNLKDAQQTIFGHTVIRNDSINRNFKKSALEEKSDSEEMTKGNQTLKDKLKNMLKNITDKSVSLLEYACRLEKFKQRRKIDNPEIIPIKSQETTKNSNAPQEPIDLTEKNEDLIGVTAHSIKNSGLFFSVPLIKDCNAENGGYDDEVLKKTFKNCLINAYYLQALSNLKEFYRQEETENTQSTQQSEQEQNREKTTKSPLDEIKTAKYEEKNKIKQEKLEQEGLSIKVDINGLSKKDSSESMTNTDSTKYIPDNISPLSSIASYDTLAFNSSSLTEDTNHDTSPLSPTEVQSCKTPETPRTPRTL